MSRQSYAWGYRTREAAQDALDDLLSISEVSECEAPKVVPYKTRNMITGQPVLRFQITLAA